jgi:hypothetical protein
LEGGEVLAEADGVGRGDSQLEAASVRGVSVWQAGYNAPGWMGSVLGDQEGEGPLPLSVLFCVTSLDAQVFRMHQLV